MLSLNDTSFLLLNNILGLGCAQLLGNLPTSHSQSPGVEPHAQACCDDPHFNPTWEVEAKGLEVPGDF